ncbi:MULTISPECIES: protein-L-isoaspartate(D-aspartate) O-methyltransferase [unclassified Ensifer]|uniref:protein-L-isoaspartate(D-aspartate) O-methyltransferase n=2 Tax=Ensifer TaxID=106591 RepID=UPI0008134B19|nr:MULTISPECIES: protein-L-isoaspartate(D-aspartate) O-methyltransferase [unclassified Ensifer]OCO98397.1 protein-L-isoaspartate O-methyltransferase [Ensifer sp. LC14]OCP02509.1 protein-L-isoaspartate O-methyltransferase [Ensifer sp. LC11]OCP02617.1 protein-L-isoaspartate O-methyltransferase [Ensifer sp. LC13]OCP29840.1 protein-L-isoaspartate O-methyltransferase [Ensifer sp. LC499]
MRPLAQCQALMATILTSAAAVVSTTVLAQDRLGERAAMIETIKLHARSAPSAVEGQGIDPAVLETIGKVPRHFFVPEEQRGAAYQDRPLPIGYGQTISQPFIVALMTDLINVGPGDTVLEIGTGSGYQAAVLSPLTAKVYSIEIIPELGERAAARLAELRFDNVEVKVGDGYYGWPAQAPFDGIVVTAAASHIPPPLVEQLAKGGRMVVPVGGPFATQFLMLVEKRRDGSITTRQLLPVAFVPLRGGRAR